MAEALSIRSLQVQRGTFSLQKVSLEVRAGEVFAILGRTGSGKTVLLESLAGAFSVPEGSVFIGGRDVMHVPVQDRHLGIVYQDYALFSHMDVLGNVEYGLRMHGWKRDAARAEAQQMLELFGISHLAKSHPGTLSGGECQRVALARALVLKPEILLLDEPFTALDPATKQMMYETFRNVHAQFDCTIVFVTHDFHEAQVLADRVGIILDGCLRAALSASELQTADVDEDVARFLGRA